ncbi:MAG TPA: 6-hydroxymethylpterin diphosphokinase MptE-like protein, partial [Spirochaetota bacterium]
KKTYLHSKIDPERERDSLRSQIDSIRQDTVIFYGSGLGYSLYPVTQNSHIKKIIIIERLQNIETSLCPYVNLIQKNTCTVEILSGKDSIALEKAFSEVIDFSETKGIAFVDHPASMRLFPEYYSLAKSVVDTVIRNKAGNEATKRSFSGAFLRNAIRNIGALDKMSSLSSIQNVWKGFPCIIVSSAPSIDYYIDTIKENEKKLFIIAVDSAYPILLSKKIRPDLIISIDPQPWTKEHLLACDLEIPVIISLTAQKHHSKKTFLSMNSHPVSQIIDHFNPGIGSADSHTGTVAGDSIVTACLLGSSRIYLAGIDFSFPQRKIYSKDSAYNHRFSFIFNNRLNSVENQHEKYIRKSSSSLRIENVPTRQSFLQYRDSVIKLLSTLDTINIYHLKGKGLSIPGSTTISSPEEASKYFSEEKAISTRSTIQKQILASPSLIHLEKRKLIRLFNQKGLIDELIRASLNDTDTIKKTSKYHTLFDMILRYE